MTGQLGPIYAISDLLKRCDSGHFRRLRPLLHDWRFERPSNSGLKVVDVRHGASYLHIILVVKVDLNLNVRKLLASRVDDVPSVNQVAILASLEFLTVGV